MGEGKKPKKTPAAARGKRHAGKGLTEPTSKLCALIRFPDPTTRGRAIRVLGEVQRPYQGLHDPEHGVQCLVTNDHLKSLRKHKIPFEILA
jgi:hypothetical protein